MTETSGTPMPSEDLSSVRCQRRSARRCCEIATMMIDELYAEHLVDEYGALCARLLDKLARK